MLPSLSVWNTSPCCRYHGTVCRVSPGFLGGGSLELTIRCDLCGSEWTEGLRLWLVTKLLQMLTSDVGHTKLQDHFRDVLAVMRAARAWKEFHFILNRLLLWFMDTLELPFDDTRAMESLQSRQIGSMIR